MNLLARLLGTTLLLSGCGSTPVELPDTGPFPDAAVDAPVDAPTDGAPDAEADAALDAVDDVSDATADAGPMTSAQIAAVRLEDGGDIDPALPVDEAYVTYLLPRIGADPAGFFVQRERMGPALFIAVDPTTLDPVPEVGDTVSFQVDAAVRDRRQHRVTGISSFSRSDSGFDVTVLAQNVSETGDLLTNLGNFESELIVARGTLRSEGSFAGTAQTRFKFVTDGEDNDRLAFRAPNPLVEDLEVGIGCSLTVGPTPLWRTDGRAQVSAAQMSEIEDIACPPPTLRLATATDDDKVRLRFSRALDASTVAVEDIAFLAPGGALPLEALSVDVDGRFIDVTTSVQVAGIVYTVTVTGVAGTRGMPIDPAANTLSFAGSRPTEVPSEGDLIITEIFYDTGTAESDVGLEWIEVFNPSATVRYQLLGCTLEDDGDSDALPIIFPVRLQPRSRVVFGGPQSETEAGFDFGPELGDMGDEVTLRCDGAVVDTVDYGAGGFPDARGRSLTLDPSIATAAANDVATNWCVADGSMYGTRGFLGTPGATNAACPGM